MRSGFRAMLLLGVAIAAVWHGVLLAVPHNHVDSAVPQEELACSASHPLSQTSHLHGSGQLLAPHSCLACFAGTSGAITPGVAISNTPIPSIVRASFSSDDCRSQSYSHLPLLRGPPAIV